MGEGDKQYRAFMERTHTHTHTHKGKGCKKVFFFSITNVKRNKFSYQPLENFAKRELLSTLDV